MFWKNGDFKVSLKTGICPRFISKNNNWMNNFNDKHRKMFKTLSWEGTCWKSLHLKNVGKIKIYFSIWYIHNKKQMKYSLSIILSWIYNLSWRKIELMPLIYISSIKGWLFLSFEKDWVNPPHMRFLEGFFFVTLYAPFFITPTSCL